MSLPDRNVVKTKLFKNGRSQAVRIPTKEFRLPGDEVLIRREGDTVILQPIKLKRWPRGYWARLREVGGFDADPMQIRLEDLDVDES